ncbi:MAG: hypothetical protein ABJA94_07890 [Rhodoglobus sp.]
MAALSRSRRATAGIALIVAGVLFLLTVLLPLVGVTFLWLGLLADVAMTVALAILGIGAVNSTLTKIALFVGAAGWAILALAGLVMLPAGVGTFAAIIAAAGGLVGAIVLYTGKEITNRPAGVFIASMILAAIFLLKTIGILPLGSLETLLIILLGAALIIAGVLFGRTEGSRR